MTPTQGHNPIRRQRLGLVTRHGRKVRGSIRKIAGTRSVDSIEKAVQKLTPAELAQFRLWFAEYDELIWDAQIERNAVAGKLDFLVKEALAQHQQGKSKTL